MKKIDFFLQAAIIVGVAISFIPFGFGGVIIALYAQLFLGLYQPISAFIRLLDRKNLSEKTRALLNYYWISTLAYLALSALFYGFKLFDVTRDEVVWFLWLMLIPWTIALLYLAVSHSDAFAKDEKRSKFLPNIHI